MFSLPKWPTLGRLASVFLIAVTLACGGGGTRSPEGSLEVFNDGNLAMTELYITPSSGSSWGVDQLAPVSLRPGDSITLTRLYPDSYDVRAYFSDGSRDEVFGVEVLDGVNTSLGMMNTGNGAVAVANASGLTIKGIYLTKVNATTWGPNQADLPLSDGQTLTLTGISPDTYDLRVIFNGGTYSDYPDILVTSGTVITIHVN